MEPGAGRASPEAPNEISPDLQPREPASPTGTVEWTTRPWREHRAAAALAVLAALALWLLAARLLPGEPLAAAVLGLAVLGSLAPGMAPIECRVDGGGVARRVLFTWERRAWPDIRRARLGAAGLFVSPLAAPGRLDRFRGLLLPVPRRGAQAEGVRRALQREITRRGL